MAWILASRREATGSVARADSHRRSREIRPGLEPMERRRLLSSLAPSHKVSRVTVGRSAYLVWVNGPGGVNAKVDRHNRVMLSLFGTTVDSQVNISTLNSLSRSAVNPLDIVAVKVSSGQLGSLDAPTSADLDGPITPLQGSVASLEFNAIDPPAAISIDGNLGRLTVSNNVELGGTGHISISGDLTGSFSVGGSLEISPGGKIDVTGDLADLSVTGVVRGSGSDDIVVGDDLGQLTILGGGGAWGLQGADIDVAESLQGLDIRNGVDDSLITAGLLIDGGTPGTGSNGWNIGPNGTVAVLDSQILAGGEIDHITIGGDVTSDLPTNPSTGRVTRIVAGEGANGSFSPGGTIDNFQIAGNLVNAVLSASVAPSQGYYHQPSGSIEVGFVSEPAYGIDDDPNDTIPVPAQPVTVSTGATNVGLVVSNPSGSGANPTQLAQLQDSPLSVDTAPPFAGTPDTVLAGGSINPSFAPKLQLVPPAAYAGQELPLPSQSTVLGSVISTSPHVNGTDYAGIFAADTDGVIVGPLPKSAPLTPS